MKKKFQVFLSSTFVDLREEREAVARVALDMGFIVSGMEWFPAADQEQMTYIRKIIDDCDYYLLIIGGRYGSKGPDGASYTEAEYEYAMSKKKTVLAFVHGDRESLPVKHVDRDANDAALLQNFVHKVTSGRLVRHWRSRDELTRMAQASLHSAVTDHPGVGWIRGDDASVHAIQAKDDAEQRIWKLEHDRERAESELKASRNAIQTAFLAASAPATHREIVEWLNGAQSNYPGKFSAQSLEFRDVRFLRQDAVLPVLHGASALTVLVASGVNIHRQGADLGHSTLLFMDGFRAEGVMA